MPRTIWSQPQVMHRWLQLSWAFRTRLTSGRSPKYTENPPCSWNAFKPRSLAHGDTTTTLNGMQVGRWGEASCLDLIFAHAKGPRVGLFIAISLCLVGMWKNFALFGKKIASKSLASLMVLPISPLCVCDLTHFLQGYAPTNPKIETKSKKKFQI